MKQKLLKKQDLILIAVILGAAILLFLGTKLMHKRSIRRHKPPDH